VLGADDAAIRQRTQRRSRIAGTILGRLKFAPAIVSAVSSQSGSGLPAMESREILADLSNRLPQEIRRCA